MSSDHYALAYIEQLIRTGNKEIVVPTHILNGVSQEGLDLRLGAYVNFAA